ncbi:GatB/YqeY domain-containing protein [Pseudahrensia aquimaris]|uniref:GatB/YqeY domain-containing protein n=1 Tax=Pseudahrensia aquimaris TaxID=744461 RepID=A0ABW3FCY0_9HYPH
MRTLLNDGMKEAMKAGDKRRLGTLRLIIAAIKDRDINARGSGTERVSDDEILQILSKMIKQREESATIYEEQSRLDLAQQEREEIEIIRDYLPKQLDAEEVRAACAEVIKDVNGESLRDMGKCMNALKERYPGKIDFGKASGVVKEMLG